MRAREGDALKMGGTYIGPPRIAWEAELGKSFWVKQIGSKKRKDKIVYQGAQGHGNRVHQDGAMGGDMKVRTILFVDQSPNGELARRMREKLRSMEGTLGFRVKVVERVGQQLGSKFSLTTVWEGTKCGRTDCVTCEQGVEELPPCMMKNALYENMCGMQPRGEQQGGAG